MRGAPTTVPAERKRSADLTGVDQATCELAIERILLAVGAGNVTLTTAVRSSPSGSTSSSRRVTPSTPAWSPEATRHLTDKYQLGSRTSPRRRYCRSAFCRECGQEYFVVAKVTRAGRTAYVPRHDSDASGGDAVTGYLYLSADHPWPLDPVTDGRLPDHWLGEEDDGSG